MNAAELNSELGFLVTALECVADAEAASGEKIAAAITRTFSASHVERDALWVDPNNTLNAVHGLFAIAHALNRIADALGAASGRRINERPEDR
jgi:hypothetical protein